MKELLILSGKGGTGKTSLCAAFARLAGNSVLADCDVDASNLPLLLKPERTETHEFFAGVFPKIAPTACLGCGHCASVCRFHAISLKKAGEPEIDLSACEGCGVCADHCPAGAIKMESRHCGRWMRSETAVGVMFHADLAPGNENSGQLVMKLRAAAKQETMARDCDWLLNDGPPGIGCPVVSASTGVDFSVVVTEPTVSGRHDLQRLTELLRQFEIPFAIVVNKYDLSIDETTEIEGWCAKNRIPVLGRIHFDPLFSEALRQGKTVFDFLKSGPAEEVRALWVKLPDLVFENKPHRKENKK